MRWGIEKGEDMAGTVAILKQYDKMRAKKSKLMSTIKDKESNSE